MKILITGGGGFIGSHLTKYFLNQSAEVIVIDNFLTGNKNNLKEEADNKHLTVYESDAITFDYSTIPTVDIIYHLASPASPIQYKKHPIETLMVNSLGTKNVLDYMHKSGSKRFVISSTSEIYGDPLEHPQKEEYWGNVNTVGPRSCYDEAKRFAEAVTYTYRTSYNLDIRIARIFNTYGPQMEKNDGRVVSNFITQALSTQPITIYGDGTQTRSFCYVSDLVEGLYRLGTIDNLSGKIINLGNPTEKTMKELAELIKKLTNSASDIVFKPIDADDPKKRKPDITKAQEILNWEPKISLEEGLTKTIAYFKSII